jgi:hypothetical protein
MPEILEQWLWLVIALIFVGFAFAVILAIFPSPLTWICFGFFVGVVVFYPLARNLPTALRERKGCRPHDLAEGRQEWLGIPTTQQLSPLLPPRKQQPLPMAKERQQQPLPDVWLHSLDEPDVRTYVPESLPSDFFL